MLIVELLIIAGVIIFDQLSKVAAENVLPSLPGGTFEVFPGFASFTYAKNTGAAFSMFSDSTFALGVIALAVAAVLFFVMVRSNKYRSKLLAISLSFLIGGAIGNIIDRFALGYVRDMIQFTFVDFAIFNVADSFASIGAVLLIIYLLFFWGRSKKKLS